MAELFPSLTDKHIAFIAAQHLYFVGTAGAAGSVNVSPKGGDTLRVIDPQTVVWLNLTGSGNETSVHVQENARMTLMFCSFDKHPLILRVYGQARVVHAYDDDWTHYQPLFDSEVGARQFFVLTVERVQTSCGYAVPRYKFKRERDTLRRWAERRGRDGVTDYWRERNQISLDGRPTRIIKDD